MNQNFKIYHGDCLKEQSKIENSSVDLILTDLPYGIMKGIDRYNHIFKKGKYDWDEALDSNDIFAIAARILKRNSKMLLFSQQPFTTKLLAKQHNGIKHIYQMYWEKDHFGNPLSAKIAPLSYIEEICVFKKLHDRYDGNPLRIYAKQCKNYINKPTKEINIILGNSASQHFLCFDGLQFALCTVKTYEDLVKNFKLDKMQEFKSYGELVEMQEKANIKTKSTFNLWDGKGHKSNLLKYAKDKDKYHPTQKPVKLLEDLIKTFSNEGDTICDLTMGSGSTGVAAMNTGRKFIGIEKDDHYFKVAKTRIENAAKFFGGGAVSILEIKTGGKISATLFLFF
ncbi:DNA-methyltransferase [Mucispirillum schaedleri]|uniref:DNA-methyltransferase n=1 Tax=Mucispirillum schaedleri TaxID=248039 RepID=UPI001F562000|nr:site-specific DNA-methyltransferase [Mucispirillum schaedleri]